MKLKTSLLLVFLSIVVTDCSPSAYSPRKVIHGATFLKPPSLRNYLFGDTSKDGGIYGANESGYKYIFWRHRLELGNPRAAVNAVGFIDADGKSRVTVAADIICTSLAFPPVDSGKAARLTIRIHLAGASVDTTTRRRVSIPRRRCRSARPYHQRLKAPPGRYHLKVQITDRTTGRHLTRSLRALVPRLHPKGPGLSSVRMQAKTDDGSWHPVAGYNIPARIDSVAFSVRLTGDTSGAPLQLQARLLRFRADTSIARPYYAPPYRKTSLAYQGIDYGDSTVVHSDRRQWAGPGSVVIQFRFARPRHGNYRFALQASGNAKALYKARDFGVKSPDFPAMHTPRERAGPLVYLMRGKYLHDHPKLLKKIKSPQQALSLLSKDSSYAKLMATSDHDSLRTAVARFWQAHLVKGSKARRVKQLYYRRVETANVLFSGYKAGWKTGRGMAYILFGRPCATDYFRNVDYYPIEPLNARNKDVFIWWYGNCNINCGYRSLPCVGINDHSGTAIHGVAHYRMDFYEPRGKSIYFPFQHFLLERGLRHRTKSHHPRLIKTSKDAITAGLIREVQLQRQLWFSGEILRRKLYWLPPHKQ